MDNIEYNSTTKKYEYKNSNTLPENVNIRSKNLNIDKTPDQVLKMIIYNLLKENNNLKQINDDLIIRRQNSNVILDNIIDVCNCSYCDIWFLFESNDNISCDICESNHCGLCDTTINCIFCNEIICYSSCFVAFENKIPSAQGIMNFKGKKIKRSSFIQMMVQNKTCYNCTRKKLIIL